MQTVKDPTYDISTSTAVVQVALQGRRRSQPAPAQHFVHPPRQHGTRRFSRLLCPLRCSFSRGSSPATPRTPPFTSPGTARYRRGRKCHRRPRVRPTVPIPRPHHTLRPTHAPLSLRGAAAAPGGGGARAPQRRAGSAADRRATSTPGRCGCAPARGSSSPWRSATAGRRARPCDCPRSPASWTRTAAAQSALSPAARRRPATRAAAAAARAGETRAREAMRLPQRRQSRWCHRGARSVPPLPPSQMSHPQERERECIE